MSFCADRGQLEEEDQWHAPFTTTFGTTSLECLRNWNGTSNPGMFSGIRNKKSELEINNMIFGHIDSTLHDHRRTYSNFLTAN